MRMNPGETLYLWSVGSTAFTYITPWTWGVDAAFLILLLILGNVVNALAGRLGDSSSC